MVSRLDQPLAAPWTADDLLRISIAVLMGIVMKPQVPPLHHTFYRPELVPALTLIDHYSYIVAGT